MDTSNQGTTNQPALTHLDFSPPQCRYESTARYTNALGQEFLLVATGLDEEEVSQYIKDIRVSITVIPQGDVASVALEERAQDAPAKEQSREEAYEESIDLRFEILETPGLEPPYLVDYIVDPTISDVSNTPHTHSYTGTSIKVSVISNDNKAKQSAFKKGSAAFGPKKNLTAGHSGSGNGNTVVFKVKVTGTGRYTISGSYTTR